MRTLKKLLRSSKGVSLMELVVAMMVFSILVMAVSTVFLPMLQTYYHAVDFAETNPLLDEISNTLLTDINQANAISVVNETDGRMTLTLNIKRAGYAAFTVVYSLQPIDDDNNPVTPPANPALYLYRAFDGDPPVLVHDPDYYRGNFTREKSVNVRYLDANNVPLLGGPVLGAFFVEVSIVGSGGGSTSRTYAADPLCL